MSLVGYTCALVRNHAQLHNHIMALGIALLLYALLVTHSCIILHIYPPAWHVLTITSLSETSKEKIQQWNATYFYFTLSCIKYKTTIPTLFRGIKCSYHLSFMWHQCISITKHILTIVIPVQEN